MSKGTGRHTFRIPDNIVDAMVATIHRVNLTRKEEPLDISEFVRLAVEEKIAHYDRARKVEPFRHKTRKKGGVSDTPVGNGHDAEELDQSQESD